MRVICSPTTYKSGLSFIFHPDEPDPWMVPEKLFLQHSEPTGTCSTATSIEITSVPDAMIASITFGYASGVSRTIGSREGDSSIFNFGAEENLTRMDLIFSDDNDEYLDQDKDVEPHSLQEVSVG